MASLPHPQVTRDELLKLCVTFGTFDGVEVVSAFELYEALGIDGYHVHSMYITMQAAGIAIDVAYSIRRKQ